MDEIKVRDRATGVIRTVTRKAYMAMGPKVYERLSPAEEQSSESPNSTGPQVSRSVRAAGPVVSEQIPAETKTDEQPETNPTFKLDDQQVKVKGKPGPKPKSISSNSTSDEK